MGAEIDGKLGILAGNLWTVVPCFGSLEVRISQWGSRRGEISRGSLGSMGHLLGVLLSLRRLFSDLWSPDGRQKRDAYPVF